MTTYTETYTEIGTEIATAIDTCMEESADAGTATAADGALDTAEGSVALMDRRLAVRLKR